MFQFEKWLELHQRSMKACDGLKATCEEKIALLRKQKQQKHEARIKALKELDDQLAQANLDRKATVAKDKETVENLNKDKT